MLRSAASRFGHRFEFIEAAGGDGAPLDAENLALCLSADSVLAGVGTGVGIRQLIGEMRLQASMRPALLYPQLAGASPLGRDMVRG